MAPPQTDRPVPTYAKEVFDALKPRIQESDTGLPTDEAKTSVQEQGFEPATVDDAVEQLLKRGYLYKVSDRLHITDEQP